MSDRDFERGLIYQLLEGNAIRLKQAFEICNINNQFEFAKYIVDQYPNNPKNYENSDGLLHHLFAEACAACYLELIHYIVGKNRAYFTANICSGGLEHLCINIEKFAGNEYVDIQIPVVSFLLDQGAVLSQQAYLYQCIKNAGRKLATFIVKRANDSDSVRYIEWLKNMSTNENTHEDNVVEYGLLLKISDFKTRLIAMFPSEYVSVTNNLLNKYLISIKHLKKSKRRFYSRSGIKCREIRTIFLHNALYLFTCSDVCMFNCRFIGFS